MIEIKVGISEKIDWRNTEPLKHSSVYDALRKEKRMKVRMFVTKPGSIDGINVIEYQAGQAYDLTERLGGVFVENGWAEEIKDMGGPPEVKTKTKKTTRKRAKK